MQDLQSLVFTFRDLYVVLFLHYRVQVCKCVFEIRQYHPGIVKRKWKERVQNALYFGIFSCGVDSSCNKDSGWRQLIIHVEHLRGITSNKSFTSFPMDCTVTRRKSFMSRSCPCCLGMNVFLSIKILTPCRILLVVIRPRPGDGWCCPWKPWAMWLPGSVSASLIAGCLSEKQRYGEQAVETYPCFLA